MLLFSTTHAYVIYKSEQAATATYKTSLSIPVCLGDRQLIVRQYRELPRNVAPGS